MSNYNSSPYDNRVSSKIGPYGLSLPFRKHILKSLAYYRGEYVLKRTKSGRLEKIIPRQYMDYLKGLL